LRWVDVAVIMFLADGQASRAARGSSA
jgi:hypothetical protein